MRASTFSASLIASLVATPICLLLALASGGAGHGNYLWAKVVFPYTMLSTLAFESITRPFIILAIIQFPLYGVALGLASRKHRFAHMAIALPVIHLLAVMILFLSGSENFS